MTSLSLVLVLGFLPGQAVPATQPQAGVGEQRLPGIPRPDDVVLRWNEAALQVFRAEKVPPPKVARTLAMVHIAMYDAVNTIHRTHTSYLLELEPIPGASAEAAAASAAHRVLVALYPGHKENLDRLLAQSLAETPATQREEGRQLGQLIAEKVLEWRRGDGSDLPGKFEPRPMAGVWQPTPPNHLPALLPEWGSCAPFAIRRDTQIRPAGPPSLTSPAYTEAFKEVARLGGRTSTARTPEQTQIAWFWADDVGTATPPGHWNIIARDVARARHNTLTENARLFALLNMSLADASVLCWVFKFHYQFWRPVTAIRRAEEDGNAETTADLEWLPLLTTPPFPAYTSGHSTFSGAGSAVLARFFGTDRVRFETTSEGLPGVVRTFPSFSAAAEEAGMSRIYGGIHWQFDNADGLSTGRGIGEYVYKNYLLSRRP